MRRDVAHVAQVTAQGYVLVVQPSLQVKTVPEFVQYLKANPDKVNYSSSGIVCMALACYAVLWRSMPIFRWRRVTRNFRLPKRRAGCT